MGAASRLGLLACGRVLLGRLLLGGRALGRFGCCAAGWPAGAAPGWPPAFHGLACTGAPGRIFWKPSTTTVSPAFRPLVTIQLVLTAPPVVTGTCSTLFSLLTSIRLWAPSGVRCSACCGTSSALSSTPCSNFTRTYMPGSSTLSGFGTSARRLT